MGSRHEHDHQGLNDTDELNGYQGGTAHRHRSCAQDAEDDTREDHGDRIVECQCRHRYSGKAIACRKSLDKPTIDTHDLARPTEAGHCTADEDGEQVDLPHLDATGLSGAAPKAGDAHLVAGNGPVQQDRQENGDHYGQDEGDRQL